MSKRPKLDHQGTAANNHDREETSSVVEYVYTAGNNDIPDNVTHVRVQSGVIKINDWKFHNQRSLKEVILNNGLEQIGSDAFSYCTALRSITLPSTVIMVGYSAFRDCATLKDVELNDGLEKMWGSVFRDCIALQSITIPSTVTEIERSAFSGCTNLRDVVLSDRLKEIGSNAFECCSSCCKVLQFHLLFMRLAPMHFQPAKYCKVLVYLLQ